jgi:hypothetical protein
MALLARLSRDETSQPLLRAPDTRLAAAGSQMMLSLARSGRQAPVTELPPPGSPEQVSRVEEVALAVAAS